MAASGQRSPRGRHLNPRLRALADQGRRRRTRRTVVRASPRPLRRDACRAGSGVRHAGRINRYGIGRLRNPEDLVMACPPFQRTRLASDLRPLVWICMCRLPCELILIARSNSARLPILPKRSVAIRPSGPAEAHAERPAVRVAGTTGGGPRPRCSAPAKTSAA